MFYLTSRTDNAYDSLWKRFFQILKGRPIILCQINFVFEMCFHVSKLEFGDEVLKSVSRNSAHTKQI